MTSIITKEELEAWLTRYGLAALTNQFLEQSWIGERLLEIKSDDLLELGVRDKATRCKMMLAIQALCTGDALPISPDERAPSYTPQLTDRVRRRCQRLATDPPVRWVPEVAETWPGPIAHEYYRLEQLLFEFRLFEL
jgi:SAM domain (Sterile alpha motif)